ncbi:MAG: formylglycine-generating enzyme family protein [Paludibacteraceae bacterium]|nr:formylglycine-generating enzyme family protein [Paludibacteraceae bacterium]
MRKSIVFISIVAAALLSADLSAKRVVIPDSLKAPVFIVGDVSFVMQRVEGGAFVMGATPDQHDEHTISDKPAHTVVLSPFYIAETEVTNALWRAVMPERRFVEDWYDPTQPITYISWHDAQLFVHRLDSLTGMPFRLPTEAEWEYAARGGAGSKGYRFAGSDLCDTVAWNTANAGFKKHQVKKKLPNELGLYDMTGNVSEWCQDWFGQYYYGTEPNPQGPKAGEKRIVRGGSFDNCADNIHLSCRQYVLPDESNNTIGLRVAFTLPNDPMMKPVTAEPELTRYVKVEGKRLKFLYVPAEQPYYIMETNISQSLWANVMGKGERGSYDATGMSKADRNRFLQRCARQSGASLAIATDEQIKQAEQLQVVKPVKVKQRKPKSWEKDLASRQQHRKRMKNAQVFADLVGVKLKTMDDPVLKTLESGYDESQPLRLIIRLQ